VLVYTAADGDSREAAEVPSSDRETDSTASEPMTSDVADKSADEANEAESDASLSDADRHAVDASERASHIDRSVVMPTTLSTATRDSSNTSQHQWLFAITTFVHIVKK